MSGEAPNDSESTPPFVAVVGVDFEPSGDDAFHEGIRLTRRVPGAVLHVLHALPSTGGGRAAMDRTAADLESMPAKFREYVVRLTTGVKPFPSLVLHVRVGEVVQTITQLAADLNADLIVVGTHGKHGVRKLALGSVSSKLAESGPCPVVIARAKDYSNVQPSEHVEPVCPDCAKVRARTGGATMWCDYHSRPQVRPHGYLYSETFPVGGHDPGIVAGSG